MKITKFIAMIAIVSFATNAMAAQADSAAAANAANDGSSTKAINIQINNSADAAQAQEQDQTQKQASAVKADSSVQMQKSNADTQADLLKKARQSAEEQTQERINEKLEVSRLKEERERADRLFGNRVDEDKKESAPTQIQTVILPAAPAPIVAPTPVQTAPAAPAKEEKPAATVTPAAPQVTIEKVEIVQPAAPAPVAQKNEEIAAPVVTPLAEKKSEEPKAEENKQATRFYIGGQLGTNKYDADNVKTNAAVGVAVGAIFQNRYVLELSYTYSNSNVADVWDNLLYHNLDQNDFKVATKYYLLEGALKPYIGVSASYIQRRYTDLYNDYYGYYNYGSFSTNENTNAINAGLLGGVDYQLNEHVMIGFDLGYDFNVYASQDANMASVYLPAGVKPLEKTNFIEVKASIKYLF